MSDLPEAESERTRLRWGVYWLLIVVAAGDMTGRIMAVNSVDQFALEEYRIRQYVQGKEREFVAAGVEGEQLKSWLAQIRAHAEKHLRTRRPFLSANDRSRMATVRSLVEHGTYEIDAIVDQPGWDTIDMVVHKNRAGEPRRYSSKPPLLATLVAGEYWLIHKLTGADLGSHPYPIGRALVFSVNVIPLIVAFFFFAKILEILGGPDWARLFTMAVLTLGTFVNTFAVVVNNHLPAVVCVVIALYAALRIVWDRERHWRYFAAAGFFAAFAAANELPALAFFGLLGLVLLWKAPRPTLLAGVPGALAVVVPFFVTNYAAHQSWRPPYMHRSATNPDDNWYDYTYTDSRGRQRESYWKSANKVGVDRGEPSIAVYALHLTVGHHGVFSLTPVWLLTVVGLGLGLASPDRRWRELSAMIALLSLVCLLFYIFRPLEDRNYGGMTSAFRWMFWFAPLWAIGMLPALSRMANRRWLCGLALVLLAASVASRSFPTWNPWTHPWIYQYWW